MFNCCSCCFPQKEDEIRVIDENTVNIINHYNQPLTEYKEQDISFENVNKEDIRNRINSFSLPEGQDENYKNKIRFEHQRSLGGSPLTVCFTDEAIKKLNGDIVNLGNTDDSRFRVYGKLDKTNCYSTLFVDYVDKKIDNSTVEYVLHIHHPDASGDYPEEFQFYVMTTKQAKKYNKNNVEGDYYNTMEKKDIEKVNTALSAFLKAISKNKSLKEHAIQRQQLCCCTEYNLKSEKQKELNLK